MIFRYKVTFFNNEATAKEWQQFFATLLHYAWWVKVVIIFAHNKINFFVESTKRLDSINSQLFPFYLSSEITELEENCVIAGRGPTNYFPKIVIDSLFNYSEKKNVENRPLARITFKIHKLNPFKSQPILEIQQISDQYRTFFAYIMQNIFVFLAFDLSKSIRSEIAKVKPVLATGNLQIEAGSSGFLELSGNNLQNKLSVDSYDFYRHSIILGQSGSGKSFLMSMILEDIYSKYNNDCSVILIDPHASLEALTSVISSKMSINFTNTRTNLFININQPILSTELALDLFSTVLNVREDQDLQRTLKFALTLLFSINQMEMTNLRSLLTDTIARKQFLKETNNASILQFFETEYLQLYTAKYDSAVLPILNLISELDFINEQAEIVDLVDAINNNFLVSVPIKQTELGKNITKVIGGALIQQVFTIAQAGLINKKLILMIDEFSVVQNPSLIHILSEARKFGLTVIFAQQYLMQVPLDLLQSIFANMVNYFCFKIARDDAEVIARNLNFEIDEYFLKNKNDPREILELGVKLLTEQNPREVICRLMAKDRYVAPFKSKTAMRSI